MLFNAQEFPSPNAIVHFITILCGVDTEKVHILPSPEFFQCGRCTHFFSRMAISHHLITCTGENFQEQSVSDPFEREIESINSYSAPTGVKGNKALLNFAISPTFVYTFRLHHLYSSSFILI